MRTRYSLFLLCVLLLSLTASAAQKKSSHKTFSKKFKEVPLEQVLEEIGKKTDFVIDYSEADLDLAAPVTISFKDASASGAIRKILKGLYKQDKANTPVVKTKKNTLYITSAPQAPVVEKHMAVLPTSVSEDDKKIVTLYTDTIDSIFCKKQTIRHEPEAPKQPEPTAKGHYIQAMLGAGYGSMGYSLRDPLSDDKTGSNMGDFTGLLQLQYAYYFHENWGFNVGLAFSGYGSYGVLNNTNIWAKGLNHGDTDGEAYEHRAITHDWREQQITHVAELPIGIQCQYPLNDNNLRLYAGLGARVGMPICNRQIIKSGTLEHQGFYEQWNMLVTDQGDRDYYTEQAADFEIDKNLNLKKIAVAADVNLGLMVPLTKQIDLVCGLYFQMNCLDLYDGEKQDIGWKQTKTTNPGVDHSYMNDYQGLLASTMTNAVRPWGAGVKVGIQWHHIKKQEAPKPTFEKIEVCDTIRTLQPRTETQLKPKKEAAKQIVRLMKKAVIWFDINSVEPKLEPADIIDQIAAIMIENPNQKVIVSGHASKEGNARRNKVLSEKRAQAVADLLISKGVKETQLTVEAHSSDIDYNAGEGVEHSIALDRRVEIIPVE